MGFGPPGRSPSHAADPPPLVPRPRRPPAAAVPPGRRPAVRRRAHRGCPRPVAGRRRPVAGPGLLPLVTLRVFLGQVLSPDHTCRAAVARLNAHRVARGRPPCSARTGAYCRARQRLPEGFFSAAACAVGRRLDAQADRRWLWEGRQVYLFDGTTVTMADTAANQAAYPQVHNQKPGLGFPLARVGALISLACGAVVNLGFCRYAGKGQGEVSLLCRLWGVLAAGDVILADRLTANWATIHL